MKPRFSIFPTLAALIFVTALLGALVLQEPPSGKVAGSVVAQESGKPLRRARVVLTNLDETAEKRVFKTRTDDAGHFALGKIPDGFYALSAATLAHAAEDQNVRVVEGEIAQISLKLERSQPDLEVAPQKRVFAPGDKVFLPIRGYVDDSQATDKAQLTIYRAQFSKMMRDEDLRALLQKAGDRYDPIEKLPAELIKVAAKTSDFAHPITKGDSEGFFHERVGLPLEKPGLYLIDVAHSGGKDKIQRACSWLLLTDTALVLKKARGEYVAFATDFKSGKALNNTQIVVFQDGKQIQTKPTDKEGLARFALGKSDDSHRLTWLARKNSDPFDEAVLGGTDSYYSENSGEYNVALYTERPIYRPGDTIFWKGIARRKAPSGPQYSVPEGQKVSAELRDPNGDTLADFALKTNRFGSFSGSAQISKEAAPGSYTLYCELNGEDFTTDISVAAYRKPEFTVEVSPAQKSYTHGDEIEMTVTGKYYFGSPVAGAKLSYEIYRMTDWAAQYPAEFGYDADEEAEGSDYGYEGEYVRDGEATLDANGVAHIRFRAKNEDEKKDDNQRATGAPAIPPQAEIWTLNVRATDDAEREVEGRGRAKVAAGDFTLNLEPDGSLAKPGQAKTVTLLASAPDGKPVAGQTVSLESGFEIWDENAKTSTYQLANTQTTVTDQNGKAKLEISVPRGGEMRLTALAKDRAGHTIGDTAYLWAASENGADLDAAYDDLSILTDKKRYTVGETADILINSAQTGQTALLTLEGDTIYRAWTVPLKTNSTRVSVPIKTEYGPNVSLVACTARDGDFAQSEAALRVEIPARQIAVEITPDSKTHAPGDEISYSITTRDAAGNPMASEVSFGVVDEAIYALAEDEPHLLRDTFYPRRYNNVGTSTSFSVEYLGDANKAGPQIEARKKFVDTAFWTADLQTDADGKANVKFKLPDNLTTWRATALANSMDSAFGRGTAPEVVSKPFFVRIDKPRFGVEGDQTRILAIVHNETGAPQSATVKLDAPDLTSSGDASQQISLGAGESGTISWPVTIGATDAKITVTAYTDDQKFTDGVEETLAIRPFGRETVQTLAGQSGGAGLNFQIDPNAVSERTRAVLRVSPSILDSLVGSLDYLVGYPYGCTEQTTSRMMPDLLVGKILRQTGRNDAKIAKDLPDMVRDSVVRLGRLQHQSGAWGWWEFDEDDPFLTAYALYGLALAKSEGYKVPESMMKRGSEAALTMAKTAPEQKDAQTDWTQNRPFLLLAAAKAGNLAGALEQRSALDLAKLEAQALAQVVLLDQMGGNSDSLETLKAKANSQGSTAFWNSPRPNWQSDSDQTTSTATALKALVAADKNSPLIAQSIQFLMARRTGDYWESTRDTAWVLDAFSDYLKAFPDAAQGGGSVTAQINGQKLRDFDLSAQGRGRDGDFILPIPAASFKTGENSLNLTGANGAFYSLEVRQTVQGADLPAIETEGFKISREFLRVLPPKPGTWKILTAPSGDQFKAGEGLRIRLTIETPRALAYVLVEDTFPAGCEPSQRGSADVSSGDEWDYWWDATTVRDDRIAFFARSLSKGKHVIEYNLRAQTPGTYRVLPAFAGPMYAPQMRAETGAGKLEIE